MSELPELHCSPDPAAAAVSAMARFRSSCGAARGVALRDPAALQALALEHPGEFWGDLLAFCGVAASGAREPALVGDDIEHARFFPALRLNWAANLLRAVPGCGDDATALIGRDEQGTRSVITRGELRRRVLSVAAGLRGLGIGPGDRVAALSGNTPEAAIACLAATGLGAAWSSVAPDLSTEAVRERFGLVAPKLLFAVPTHRHHGAHRDLRARLRELAQALPSLRQMVALREPLGLEGVDLPEHDLARLAESPALDGLPELPFDHPLFVLFSSGTTGKPKAIVHGHGGTLLEHVKELALHSDLGPSDLLYFHTTCGWMMWNWQLSALFCGTPLLLYDGSVSHPGSDALLRMLAEEGVSVFGTSPAYLQYLRESGVVPRELSDWPRLRALQSTGSVLFEAQYEWVSEHWKVLPIQSISGGTDVLGCLVLGHPELPVLRGDSQCVSLGIDVRVLQDGRTVHTGTGELVCCAPFPSRPVGFLGDPDGARFHAAYFAEHAGLWTHGDLATLRAGGGARILGRSDGTLNIRGVRLGPAEIYRILQGFPGLSGCMALEQQAPGELGGSRLVLLVVLAAGQALERPFVLRLKKELSQRGSQIHVPAVVASVTALPTTFSGKQSERAATEALHGRPVRNRAALRNPESLDEIAAHPDLHLGP